MWFAAGVFCAAAGAVSLLRSEYEREQLSVERTVVKSSKIGKNLRLVFLSDLHSHCFGADNERLLKTIDHVNPDVVLVGGDMMVVKKTADTSVSLRLMEKLTSRYPVFYGNGNHENRMDRERFVYGDQYDTYENSLKKLGVIVLSDRTELYRKDIAITGVDLKEGCYKDFCPERLLPVELEQKAGKASKERYQILLSHSPLYFPAYQGWGADLTLCGHFHGGTIRLPFLGGVMTPQYQFFNPCCAGTFQKDEKYMIVSRGLGTHSINIRLNNKPQVVVVDLKPKSLI